jgi:hypothetical protein
MERRNKNPLKYPPFQKIASLNPNSREPHFSGNSGNREEVTPEDWLKYPPEFQGEYTPAKLHGFILIKTGFSVK